MIQGILRGGVVEFVRGLLTLCGNNREVSILVSFIVTAAIRLLLILQVSMVYGYE